MLSAPALPQIEGEQEVCQGAQEEMYVLGDIIEGLTYTCNIQPSDAGTVEVTDYLAKLSLAPAFEGELQLLVQAQNICDTSTVVSYTVNVNAMSIADFDQTDVYVCGDEDVASAKIVVSGVIHYLLGTYLLAEIIITVRLLLLHIHLFQ